MSSDRHLLYDGRTPQDYAIEHAGYLATAARNLIAALNLHDAARLKREESDSDESHDDVESTGEALSDARHCLSNAIFEFEKRRDRAKPSSRDYAALRANKGQPDPPDRRIPGNGDGAFAGSPLVSSSAAGVAVAAKTSDGEQP